jgi:hypothetical protein
LDYIICANGIIPGSEYFEGLQTKKSEDSIEMNSSLFSNGGFTPGEAVNN